MKRSLMLLTLWAIGFGCATGRPAVAPTDIPFPARGHFSVAHPTPDERVGVYVSKGWGFHTRSYWLEGPEGLVLIDTQFIPSAGLEAVERAEAITNKKVVLAVVLHANPDKFNGTSVLQDRGIRVITSKQINALIPSVHASRTKSFYERYKPDYPTEVPEPEVFGDQTVTMQAAGLSFTLHVVGPGCSDAHVVLEFDDHVFAGDLVANGAHAWLELARTEAWHARLEEMRALQPRYVHPGRGKSGGPELLDAQADYLRQVSALVATESPTGTPNRTALARIKEKVVAQYPDHYYPVFLRIGLPAEWRRQAGLQN